MPVPNEIPHGWSREFYELMTKMETMQSPYWSNRWENLYYIICTSHHSDIACHDMCGNKCPMRLAIEKAGWHGLCISFARNATLISTKIISDFCQKMAAGD